MFFNLNNSVGYKIHEKKKKKIKQTNKTTTKMTKPPPPHLIMTIYRIVFTGSYFPFPGECDTVKLTRRIEVLRNFMVHITEVWGTLLT